MRRPPALGYLRLDVSGISRPWDETRMRSLANRWGYDLIKTITHSDRIRDPISELVAEVTRLEVDAVFVPSLHHLEGAAPRPLVLIASLCTVTPEDVFDRKWLQSVPNSSSM